MIYRIYFAEFEKCFDPYTSKNNIEKHSSNKSAISIYSVYHDTSRSDVTRRPYRAK